ncbi:MAG TPA: hypothetical protein VJJ72_02340 [Candidatus Paceibacterota bacterium]
MAELPSQQKDSRNTTLNRLKGTREAIQNPDAAILLKELASGELPAFDRTNLELLERAIKDGNKATILKGLHKGSGVLQGVGPKVVGILSVPKSMEIGQEYVDEAVTEATKEKAIEILDNIAINITVPDLPSYKFESEWLQWLNTLQEYVNKLVNDIEAWYKVAVEQKVNEKIQEFSAKAADVISTTSGDVIGWLAQFPAGVLGYLATSAFAGGTIGGTREWLRATGFQDISKAIEDSQRMIQEKKRNEDGSDPRLALIALHERIAKDPKLLGYRLNNREWVVFVAAVRSARVDLLREKTRVPEIIVSEEVLSGLERQKKIIDAFISAQTEIAEEDVTLAENILIQFESKISAESQPLITKQDEMLKIHKVMARYSRRIGRGALEGTGIPLLSRMASSFLRGTFTVFFKPHRILIPKRKK